jgi:hypothetical protein
MPVRITVIQPVDDCVDTSVTREIRFDSPLSAEVIVLLGNFGELQFYRTFARPLFRLLIDNRIHVKGIEGNDHCTVILDQGDLDGSLARVREMFESVTAQATGAGRVSTA